MTEHEFGVEEMTDEDRAYRGSRFADVRDAIFSNPYQAVWTRDGSPRPPTYQVTLANVLRGILPGREPYRFQQAVDRAIDSKADLRWGYNGQGFRRLLHPNGVCLTGRWRIDRSTPYSGYFRERSEALLVARYSTCCNSTRRGTTRSLSLVGKLFPTTDRNHVEPLRTANFITQQDIGGERSDYLNDAILLNAPNTTAWRRGLQVPVLLVEGIVFGWRDRQPTMRQLYTIAELGKSPGEPTRSPQFMRLCVAPDQPRIEGDRLDFRDEVMAHIHDDGDPTPKRTLTFDIEVTDIGVTRGIPVYLRRSFERWRKVGTITFSEAVVSYNGDFVLHFNHPTWRADRNAPESATRVNERRVG